MTIQDGIVVGMHYTLKNDSGDIVDTSQGQEPLVFIHGFGTVSYTHLTLPTKA